MSIKSIGIATRGLLARGLKQALHIATKGLLRTDGVQPEPPLVKPGGTFSSSRLILDDRRRRNEALALIIALDGVL